MKFVRPVTVCVSFAAMTVMSGFDCAPETTSKCVAEPQELTFRPGVCQPIVFCDSAVGMVNYRDEESQYDIDLSENPTATLQVLFLADWLAYHHGELCAYSQLDETAVAAAATGVPTSKNLVIKAKFTPRSFATATGTTARPEFAHEIRAHLQTLDFAPAISNATRYVELGDRKVAVFVQSTAVTELKLQANLTPTPASGTISYQLPEMPATMTTVPAANTEAVVSISQGIAVGEGATVKATLEADGETIEREAEVRVVARSDDPILDVQQRATEGCSASCAGAHTYFRTACFTTAQSLASADNTQSAITWSRRLLLRGGAEVAADEAVIGRVNANGEFAVCYRGGVSAFTVRIEARNVVTSGVVAHEFELDPGR